jgi:hypothetical protein
MVTLYDAALKAAGRLLVLIDAGATDKVRRALKSAEGAERHAALGPQREREREHARCVAAYPDEPRLRSGGP